MTGWEARAKTGRKFPMHKVVAEVTARIQGRSRDRSADYVARMQAAQDSAPGRAKLSCANWAHAFAGQPGEDKRRMLDPSAPNIAIVSSYNDMLSAPRPSSPAACRPCAMA